MNDRGLDDRGLNERGLNERGLNERRLNDRGLNDDGTIAREGALDRVPAAFVPVVDAARARITAAFGGPRLHSAYLYGSIPRGTAVPGVSDLDLLIVFRDEPAAADRAAAAALQAALDDAFPQITGVGIVLGSVPGTLSELERYDGGFFVACLCTPLLGDDLAARLPRYRPTRCWPARPTATWPWSCRAGAPRPPKPPPRPAEEP